MPEIVVSPNERARVETVAAELDAAIGEFFADVRDHLTDEQWDSLVRFARSSVRRVLEVGPLLHALVDHQRSRSVAYPGRGRGAFVRQALAAWRDSFAPMPDVWKLAPVFERVPGGEQRILAEVTTLEVMAANRMLASLDDQCAEFLASEGDHPR